MLSAIVPDRVCGLGDDRWASVYLYHEPPLYGQAGDRVIATVAMPVAEYCRTRGWTDSSFFVRYGVDGPHLRLRLRLRPGIDEVNLREAVGAFVTRHVAPGDATAGETYTPAVERLRWVAYEPEIDRYGGADALTISEDIFAMSSTLASELLAFDGSAIPRTSRVGRALAAGVATIRVFAGSTPAARRFACEHARQCVEALCRPVGVAVAQEQLEQLFTSQSTASRGLVREIIVRLDAGETTIPALDTYIDELDEAVRRLQLLQRARRLRVRDSVSDTWAQAVRHLLPSHLHMLNNRFGIAVSEEPLVAYFAARCFDDWSTSVAHG